MRHFAQQPLIISSCQQRPNLLQRIIFKGKY